MILQKPNRPKSWTKKSTRSLAVFLGSGGHTSESLALVSSLEFEKYSPRTYIISEGDSLSAKKAHALETLKKPGNTDYEILTMPRARKVHQSLLTTPFTAAFSLIWTLRTLTLQTMRTNESFADVLLINGPGTCFVLALGVYLNRFLGVPSPRVVYVESFARVNSLSLSGKLVQPLADRFLVQWPSITKTGSSSNIQHRGWLV
ncbi:oligosaccharide biosynthesis protein Alg14 like protein [Ceratobasidium sp. AG-I]|nr:oligosaccharide biosynthesis protein Alg14 like protein [Ceratobasidium sp. AG-I]